MKFSGFTSMNTRSRVCMASRSVMSLEDILPKCMMGLFLDDDDDGRLRLLRLFADEDDDDNDLMDS